MVLCRLSDLGLAERVGCVELFVGLGVGMWEVLRLSVRKSGGCWRVGSGRREANNGLSRLRWALAVDCFRFLLGLSGLLLEAMVSRRKVMLGVGRSAWHWRDIAAVHPADTDHGCSRQHSLCNSGDQCPIGLSRRIVVPERRFLAVFEQQRIAITNVVLQKAKIVRNCPK